LSGVNLEECDFDSDEEEDLSKLKPEELLLRWFNERLVSAGQPKVRNFGKDLKDSKPLLYAMNDLKPNKCSLKGLDEPSDIKRAQKAIDNSYLLGCENVVGPRDIVKGNEKVNMLFVAELFKH